MYTAWDLMVRELGGGIWFWTSLWLVFAFVAYLTRESISRGKPDKQVVFAAAALVIYFSGSMIRGFLTWSSFFMLAMAGMLRRGWKRGRGLGYPYC